MGMYCACKWKMTGSLHIDIPNKTSTYYEPDPVGCTCDWNGWTSICDWPDERKNKDKPLGNPLRDGKYLVRIQNQSGDRYEDESYFTLKTRIIQCGYTGFGFEVNWSGDDEEQPYAWKEIENGQVDK